MCCQSGGGQKLWSFTYFLLKNMFPRYFLIKNMFRQQARERVPLSVGLTSVRNECCDLPTGASDRVWHHPSVLNTYLPLTAHFRASRAPKEPSARYPRHPGAGGSQVHSKGEIRVQYWRMVSNMVRCTRWKVITLDSDRQDPYTQWYALPSLLTEHIF